MTEYEKSVALKKLDEVVFSFGNPVKGTKRASNMTVIGKTWENRKVVDVPEKYYTGASRQPRHVFLLWNFSFQNSHVLGAFSRD